mmetsp:Transcript_53772/g.123720  ORF Transcript_53772/g.123720 Transcript_53772/m.123720 type:complete len:241 (+) Transcript_53772:219-941(+)
MCAPTSRSTRIIRRGRCMRSTSPIAAWSPQRTAALCRFTRTGWRAEHSDRTSRTGCPAPRSSPSASVPTTTCLASAPPRATAPCWCPAPESPTSTRLRPIRSRRACSGARGRWCLCWRSSPPRRSCSTLPPSTRWTALRRSGSARSRPSARHASQRSRPTRRRSARRAAAPRQASGRSRRSRTLSARSAKNTARTSRRYRARLVQNESASRRASRASSLHGVRLIGSRHLARSQLSLDIA